MLLHFDRYIFLEYHNPHDAQDAVLAANGYKLDKQHTFVVNLFSDFDKYVHLCTECASLVIFICCFNLQTRLVKLKLLC